MARRPSHQTTPASPPPPSPKKQLTGPEMRRGIERLRERITALKAFDPAGINVGTPPEISGLQVDIKATLSRIFGDDTADYRRFAAASDLQWFPTFAVGNYPALTDYQEGIREKIAHSIAFLDQAVRYLEEEIADQSAGDGASTPVVATRNSSRIFIVHGHDEGPREAVRSFLMRLGFEPIVLHDQPNKGRTIITKFREEAGGVGFAVVLMTPDDHGKARDAADFRPRARQNVVFELGFFIGELGPDRVAALVKGGVERPSDLDGVVYIDIDDGGGWKMMLARELRAAGFDFDANKVFE